MCKHAFLPILRTTAATLSRSLALALSHCTSALSRYFVPIIVLCRSRLAGRLNSDIGNITVKKDANFLAHSFFPPQPISIQLNFLLLIILYHIILYYVIWVALWLNA